MKGIKLKLFCIVFLISFCLTLTSCKLPENILRSSSEVDFATPQNVQVSFNERVYDTIIVYKDSEVEIEFINDKELMNGACVFINSKDYKISYNGMIFEGETETLMPLSLPFVVYSFFLSFDNGIVLDCFDNERDCYYVKKIVNDYIVVLEGYEKENKTFVFSMEIK